MRYSIGIKRICDVILSGGSLLLLSPVLALIALAIKCGDGGPVFFVQERVGQSGRCFRCFKFRSMVSGARERGLGGEVAADDDRLTRVGRVLRIWTLDEIPQLLNVLRGEMSVVGPRPWIPRQVEQCPAWARQRFEMKPGLAGWAWIHGRNLVPWEERLRMDVWYVKNWSLRLDASILVRAMIQLVRRHGVYGPEGITTDPQSGVKRDR